MLVLFLLVASGAAHTGVRAHSAADPAHAETRRWSALQREWRPAHADDLQVLGAEPDAVVGYNRRTGRVFAKRAAPTPRAHLAFSEAAIVADCKVLARLGPHRFGWERVAVEARAQSWEADYGTGAMEEVRQIRLRNREDGEHCLCPVGRTSDEWRATALRQRTGDCVPWDPKREVAPGLTEHPVEPHRRSRTERASECEGLSRALDRAFVVVHTEQAETLPCANYTRLGLQQVEVPATDPFVAPRESRGKVLRDAKHAAQLVDAVDAPLAVITKSMETMAGQFHRFLGGRIQQLHNHSMLTPAERSARLRADDGPIRTAYPRACDAPEDDLVRQLLQARVSHTPQTSNTTLVTRRLGAYILELVECMATQIQAVSGAMRCAAAAMELQENTTDPADTTHALAALRRSLDGDGDRVVQLAVDVTETIYRRLVVVVAEHAAVTGQWPRYDGHERDSGIVEDMWCCLVQHVLADPRFPPCERRVVRMIKRELK